MSLSVLSGRADAETLHEAVTDVRRSGALSARGRHEYTQHSELRTQN
jgi:hypothetical protein